MTDKILLTGATGFVGKQVLKALQKTNSDITLIVRSNWKEQIENQNCINSIVITKDIFLESINWWENVCKSIDTIVHLAWYVEPGKYLQSDKNTKCVLGTLNLANGAAISGVSRIVGIGTCFEYDLVGGILSINTPLKPLTPYAIAKVTLFEKLTTLLMKQNIEFAWCRLFYLYGEGEDERRLVPYIRSKLKSGLIAELSVGNQIRDFMDVEEAGQMIVDIAKSNLQGAVNVCSEVPTTIRQLAEKIADEYGRRDLLKFGARPNDIFDPHCVVGIR